MNNGIRKYRCVSLWRGEVGRTVLFLALPWRALSRAHLQCFCYCVTLRPLRFCPNWSDWGQKNSSPVNLKTDLMWYLHCIFYLSLLILPLLRLEGESCCLPGCPPSVTLISPSNYSRYQPPNASLSPLGISAWKRREMERECRGWWQARGSSVRPWGDWGLW